MSHTAHRDQRMMEEITMSPEELNSKCEQLAELVKKTSKIIFFSGAGLSTASDIGDYRSSTGLWTLASQGREREFKSVPLHLAKPNLGHMSIVEFQNRGKLGCVISQNVDGLHLKSGILPDNICELHGNSTVEECDQCGKAHHRDICISGDAQHYTGRRCVACGDSGRLRDSIINFGENLNPRILERAYDESRHADLHICIGSSLGVSPACDLPRETKRKNGGKIVIVNLQRTPLDGDCDIRFHCKINDFFECLFQKLGWTVPDWCYRRQVSILAQDQQNSSESIRFCATQPYTSTPSSAFGKISLLATPANASSPSTVLEEKDFTKDASAMNDICPTFTLAKKSAASSSPVFTFSCESFFMKERNEPGKILIPFNPATTRAATYIITTSWSPKENKFSSWNIEHIDSISHDQSEIRSVASLKYYPNFARGLGETRVQGIRSSNASGKDDKSKNQQDFTGWFAITPLSDCIHTKDVRFADGCVFDLNRACEDPTCKHVGENMMCFTCGAVFCGRHAKGHMLKHFEETNHSIVCAFQTDLSCWCYSCEAYINESNPKITPLHRLLYAAKFGSEDPQVMINSAAPDDKEDENKSNNNNNNRGGSKRNKPTQAARGADNDDEDDDQSPSANVVDTKYKEEQSENDRTGFAVDFLASCAHTNSSYVQLHPGTVFDINSPCVTCGNVGENWFCMTCNKVYCSRYVNGCMQKHFHDETHQQHPLCQSFSDMSIYCNSCGEYISNRNETVSQFSKLMHLAKFGVDEQ